MLLNLPTLQSLCPSTKAFILDQYWAPLNDVIAYYDMNTAQRFAGFLSNIMHESVAFNAVRENLNYSESGLLNTFPKYFNATTAKAYAHRPERIASLVYANRMGNGPEESGDGWKFRGRGLIQITGHDNYISFAQALDMSLDDTVAYMETPAGACSSAGWYWDTNKLNSYCDSGDFIGLVKRINGGTHGLSERQYYYQKCLNLYNSPS